MAEFKVVVILYASD